MQRIRNRHIAKILVLSLVLVCVCAIWQRHWLLISLTASSSPPELLNKAEEGPGVMWLDDYFTIEEIAPRTFAIGEPRYHQQVFNYLIIGSERALLFDAGPGIKDIRSTVESLTDLPILFVPSHFHFDHTGNRVTFAQVGVVDLPYLRERTVDGQLALTWQEHLGAVEGFKTPTLEVGEWITPDTNIELGDRTLKVMHTPGHTQDSISLYDAANGIVFSGDFIYPGPLIAFLPNSSLSDYLGATEALLKLLPADVILMGAHRMDPPGAPRLGSQDLADLKRVLVEIREGERAAGGFYPATYPINERMALWAEPRWLQSW